MKKIKNLKIGFLVVVSMIVVLSVFIYLHSLILKSSVHREYLDSKAFPEKTSREANV